MPSRTFYLKDDEDRTCTLCVPSHGMPKSELPKFPLSLVAQAKPLWEFHYHYANMRITKPIPLLNIPLLGSSLSKVVGASASRISGSPSVFVGSGLSLSVSLGNVQLRWSTFKFWQSIECLVTLRLLRLHKSLSFMVNASPPWFVY